MAFNNQHALTCAVMHIALCNTYKDNELYIFFSVIYIIIFKKYDVAVNVWKLKVKALANYLVHHKW